MELTYRQLRNTLNVMDPSHLEDTVTVYSEEEGEYYPVSEMRFSTEDDVLDAGHLYLILQFEARVI